MSTDTTVTTLLKCPDCGEQTINIEPDGLGARTCTNCTFHTVHPANRADEHVTARGRLALANRYSGLPESFLEDYAVIVERDALAAGRTIGSIWLITDEDGEYIYRLKDTEYNPLQGEYEENWSAMSPRGGAFTTRTMPDGGTRLWPTT